MFSKRKYTHISYECSIFEECVRI